GSDAATFVLVASPRSDAIADAIFFHDQLEARGMPFGGAVVNRFHDARGSEEEVDLADQLGAELATKVEANFADYKALADRDRANLRRLTGRLTAREAVI